jgi:CBS domain containing-hemolysin-like protein
LVVGVITLSDIMITVMGDWVTPMEEDQQIIKRDNNSWLIDGSTPIEDVKHVLEIDEMPDEENYETMAGFMMYQRKIPRPADSVEFSGLNLKLSMSIITKLTNYWLRGFWKNWKIKV